MPLGPLASSRLSPNRLPRPRSHSYNRPEPSAGQRCSVAGHSHHPSRTDSIAAEQGGRAVKRLANRILLILAGTCTLALATGCDSKGVTDIVFGSLQLAFGIVDLAT